jgi:[acyl-carrier-protein] S-malonyltransferase
MTRALIFPGQGSQAVGMGQALAEASAAAREVFEEVNEALGQNLSRLMWQGPIDDLTLTENAQPAIMAVSLAVIRVLEREGKLNLVDLASHAAGHSLGEYSALCASGALDIAQTARLLKLRGQAMQAAVPVGVGAMAALLGVDLAQAEAIAAAGAARPEDDAQGPGQDVCAVANDNAPGQIVISGHKAAVERAILHAKSMGKKAMSLPVSAPFHCALMQPAADAMAKALESAPLQAPFLPIIANVTAGPVANPADIRRLLVDQVCGRVRWRESVAALVDGGVHAVIECGAGKALTGMVKRINPDVTLHNVATPEDVEALLKAL